MGIGGNIFVRRFCVITAESVKKGMVSRRVPVKLVNIKLRIKKDADKTKKSNNAV